MMHAVVMNKQRQQASLLEVIGSCSCYLLVHIVDIISCLLQWGNEACMEGNMPFDTGSNMQSMQSVLPFMIN